MALFDESIYDGGPVQLLEKRREFGIRTLQPLYMDFLIDRISVPSDSDAWLLQISFECTAACNCVLIADKCALVDKQRSDDTTTQDLAMMAVWDKHTFDGCDTSLLTRSFALPQKGFCDAILLVFDLEEQHSFGDLPFGGLRVIGNGHHLFCARADQLQLLPERRDLFCIPLAHLPPGVYRAPYNYSVTDVAFYKDAPQFPKLLSFDRLSASFRLDAVQRFRSLTVYVQRRALLSTAMSRLAKNK